MVNAHGRNYVCVEFNYGEKYDLHKPDHSFTWRERCQFILISSDNLETVLQMLFAFRYVTRFYTEQI